MVFVMGTSMLRLLNIYNRTTLLKLDTDRQNYNFAANLETLRSGKLFHK